ncbi:amidase signature enzyme [Viridothelium virens]|uniref:Amidase signature enzyme n=1 Tax=Viridothelium virens TaxID=1048519 RepID=A0A6A6H3Y2_VIRVR|nr:amidase signature enzyme [Viridothelium virens]
MVEHRTLSPLNSSPHHIFKIGYKDYLTLPVSTDNKSFNPSQSSFELLAGASRLSDGGRHGVPFTFIHCAADQSIDCNWIEKNLKTWLHVDDVFCHDFLIAVIFVVREGSRIDLAALSRGMQENWGTRWCTVISQQSVPLGNCSGPHVFWKGEIWKAYRLYDDVNETFMTSIRASSNFGSFQALRVSGDFYQSLSVAVPSRIQPPELDNKPLQGIRFAVKDVFEIEGLRVTAGSRAFYSVSKSSRATAPSIQRLIDAGGMLLGTLKLGSLIAREEPSESVDYHAAFNPRGDGYQSAWSSSGGCGAASASYDWIDFTLGTDTTGSSRRPALANGTFQIRLSHNVLSMEGVVASFPPFDAPAMFARNIVNLEDWVSVWIDAAKGSYDKLPISLIYLQDFLPVENKVQMQHVDKFISDFESTYGIKTEKVSLAKIWHAAPPIGADDPCLQSFLKDVGLNSFCYGTYRCFDRFRCEYWERFGKLPYVNPVTRWRW